MFSFYWSERSACAALGCWHKRSGHSTWHYFSSFFLSSSEALTFLPERRQLGFQNFAWAPKLQKCKYLCGHRKGHSPPNHYRVWVHFTFCCQECTHFARHICIYVDACRSNQVIVPSARILLGPVC